MAVKWCLVRNRLLRRVQSQRHFGCRRCVMCTYSLANAARLRPSRVFSVRPPCGGCALDARRSLSSSRSPERPTAYPSQHSLADGSEFSSVFRAVRGSAGGATAAGAGRSRSGRGSGRVPVSPFGCLGSLRLSYLRCWIFFAYSLLITRL